MKIYKTYLWLLLSIILSSITCGCADDLQESVSQGVQIKAFMPSAVMENTEMVITGNNLDEVSAIIFPDEIEVRSFELVTANMIKVMVPAGVSSGKLCLLTAEGITGSADDIRIASPQITSMEPGDEVREQDILTFKGEDLECISKIVFPGAEGSDIVVDAMSFIRKSSGHLKVRVPVGIMGGMSSIRLIAANGDELKSGEINLLAAAKDPEGSVKCYIQHIGSERYLTRNTAEDYPRVMSYTGSREQEFSFLPVDGMPGKYYLKNSSTGEYLVIGDENDWRMIWVFDPTTISIPERGMYQVLSVNGSANIQIKNVGSGMLGTDSNDENSEVYGNKWGETEPRFLWKLEILSGSFETPDSGSSDLWSGELEFGDWNILDLEADLFINLKIGDKIRMHFTPETGQYAQMDLRDRNDVSFPGFEWLGLGEAEGSVDLPVSEDTHARITSGGLLIRGSHYTITKVEIISETTVEIGNILWEGSQDFGDWYVVTISAEYLQNLKASDTIRMTFTAEEGQWPQMDLRDSNDVSFPGFEWLGLADYPDGYVDFKMDELIQQRLMSGGLLIRGSHYTLIKVEIL